MQAIILILASLGSFGLSRRVQDSGQASETLPSETALQSLAGLLAGGELASGFTGGGYGGYVSRRPSFPVMAEAAKGAKAAKAAKAGKAAKTAKAKAKAKAKGPNLADLAAKKGIKKGGYVRIMRPESFWFREVGKVATVSKAGDLFPVVVRFNKLNYKQLNTNNFGIEELVAVDQQEDGKNFIYGKPLLPNEELGKWTQGDGRSKDIQKMRYVNYPGLAYPNAGVPGSPSDPLSKPKEEPKKEEAKPQEGAKAE